MQKDMTYENALEWVVDHLPIIDYEDFREWYNAIESELQTPNLTDSPKFRSMAEEKWDREGGNNRPEQLPEPRSNRVMAGTPEVKEKPQRKFTPQPKQQEENRRLPPTGRAPIITPFNFFGE